MEIKVKRLAMNGLYTEGVLVINDMRTTSTVEHTQSMLPVGTYSVRIVKRSARKQYIGIFRNEETTISHNPFRINVPNTGWKIGVGHSWISCKKDCLICIGERLIPGAMCKGGKEYERLIDRLTKCKERNESITLIVTESQCIENKPIRHWLEHPMHGCPPSEALPVTRYLPVTSTIR